jgi:hypothetical protein
VGTVSNRGTRYAPLKVVTNQNSIPRPRQPAPRYGEAAAVYAMYQSVFLEQTSEQPPQKPRRGLWDRLTTTVGSLCWAPAYAYAPASR